MTMPLVNALTIDIEDYFHIHAFSDVIHQDDWDSFEPRVEQNTHRLLDLLDSVKNHELSAMNCELGSAGYQPRATFFILGWIAERYPALVKEIQARGHEVACHGYGHQRIHTQTSKEFREDVRRSKEVLENVTGTEVIGYRAPTYSINKNTIWALEILFELGFRYDSSFFPIKHDFYGFPEAPRFPFYIDLTDGDLLSQLKNPKYLHEMEHTTDGLAPYALHLTPASGLIEFPISTISVLGRNLSCSGGGYFRLFPYWLARWSLKVMKRNESVPPIFYIHPWELDVESPKIGQASRLSKFRTYVNIRNTKKKFEKLLSDFQFISLASVIKNLTPPR
jgi:polysaccharide deacetylase family protein (PEP-CTERM system associated)